MLNIDRCLVKVTVSIDGVDALVISQIKALSTTGAFLLTEVPVVMSVIERSIAASRITKNLHMSYKNNYSGFIDSCNDSVMDYRSADGPMLLERKISDRITMSLVVDKVT